MFDKNSKLLVVKTEPCVEAVSRLPGIFPEETMKELLFLTGFKEGTENPSPCYEIWEVGDMYHGLFKEEGYTNGYTLFCNQKDFIALMQKINILLLMR